MHCCFYVRALPSLVKLERTQTTTGREPLAAMPSVNPYLYIPDRPPCMQMLQLRVVDPATWCVHGTCLHSITPQPAVKPEGSLP